MTRAKFRCVAKTERWANVWNDTHTNSEPGVNCTVELVPVTATNPENNKFYASTPSGKIELGLTRKETADLFELEKEYYVDFTKAE